MIKKYRHWYNSLTPVKKLAFSFTVNCLYWLGAGLLLEDFVLEEERSLSYHLFQATWMGLWMTIFFTWGPIKALFKKRENEETGPT